MPLELLKSRQLAAKTAWLTLCPASVCPCNCSCAEKRVTTLNKTLLIVTDLLSQPDARAQCIARGGELATLESADERNLTVSEMFVDPVARKDGFWIGLQTTRPFSNTRAEFAWLSTGRTPTVDAWLPEQPDNLDDLEGICVVQSISPRGWNDRRCELKLPSICQLGEWGPNQLGCCQKSST